MPNWVFNTINGYTPDLHDKYKSDDYEIDFDKVIPEPEEIKTTPNCSFNEVAKDIAKYKEYKTDRDRRVSIKHDFNNPLRDRVDREAERAYIEVGKVSIESPDETLNNLLKDDKNRIAKQQYDDYVEIFGNRVLDNLPSNEFESIYDKYCDIKNEKYQQFVSGDPVDKYMYPTSIEKLGKLLIDCKEKYGFDNWYDWRVANWGTKWNACESAYDEECEMVKFDTAWSIPYQIISKIAQDNPNAKLDGYSEEEQGWFDEYRTENGDVHITCHGELTYFDEDGNELETPGEQREEVDEIISYDDYVKQERKYWTDSIENKPKFY